MAAGRDHADARALAFEQRVQPVGRPVKEAPHLREHDAGLLDDRLDPHRRVTGRREDLGAPNLAGHVVANDEVGERAADIDREIVLVRNL